jgi:hypothetical protein
LSSAEHDPLEHAGELALRPQLRGRDRAGAALALQDLDAEEVVILHGYAADDPEAAAAIRDEHTELRRLLLQVGVEVELHVVRLPTLQRLRAHAAREDVGMYPWAQLHLPLPDRRRLFVRIGRSLRALTAARAA